MVGESLLVAYARARTIVFKGAPQMEPKIGEGIRRTCIFVSIQS